MSWAWNSQEEEHPPAMDLRALSSLPSKMTWVGKTQKGHLGHSVPSGYAWAGEGDGGEPASGAVSSGGFLKENYFDEYI